MTCRCRVPRQGPPRPRCRCARCRAGRRVSGARGGGRRTRCPGRSPRRPLPTHRRSAGDRPVDAWIGSVLPLTKNGSSPCSANGVRTWSSTAWLATSSPGADFCIRRAARLTVSPITVNVRRRSEPRSPMNTGPRLSPARIGSATSASRISRAVRTAASSSCPVDRGAPAVRMILPPPAYTSLASQNTP